jgi:hypothetical protein
MADPPGARDVPAEVATIMDTQDQSRHASSPTDTSCPYVQSVLAALPSPSQTGGCLPTHRLHNCDLYDLQAIFGLRM